MFTWTALSTYPFCLSAMSFIQLSINQFMQFLGLAPVNFGTAVCDFYDFANAINP